MSFLADDILDAQFRQDAAAESVAIKRLLDSQHKAAQTPLLRFYGKLAFGTSDCWYWRGSRNRLGYGQMVTTLGETKAHRVSWVLHHGPIPSGQHVLHRCDVRACVNPDHLFLGSHAENMADMVAKGRHVNSPKFGEDNPMSKLTRDQVRHIRELYRAGGFTMKQLADLNNVSVMTVQRAITRQTWSKS